MPSNDDIVATAATAAEEVITRRYHPSAVDDLDITVSFADETLSVDVYIDVGAETPDAEEREQDAVNEAVRAAGAAVDRLFEDRSD